MGVILSRLRRKKSTEEILENLENKIKNIERDEQNKQQTRKRILGYVLAYSILLYVVFAILYYNMYVGRSHHWLHSVMYASPLLLLPILVIFLRSAISWYYNWTLDKNRLKLRKMRDEKKKILEDVMNTETYKVAKEILDKYGSSSETRIRPFDPSNGISSSCPPAPTVSIRGPMTSTPLTRNPAQNFQRQMGQFLTPVPNANNKMALVTSKSPQPVGLPRPLPPLQRSTFDKFVDFLLQDGPNNRMALICSECHGHNGMAIPEEFEYVTYVCAYCRHKNLARKRRPIAPPLASTPSFKNSMLEYPKSPPETSSESDTLESDKEEPEDDAVCGPEDKPAEEKKTD